MLRTLRVRVPRAAAAALVLGALAVGLPAPAAAGQRHHSHHARHWWAPFPPPVPFFLPPPPVVVVRHRHGYDCGHTFCRRCDRYVDYGHRHRSHYHHDHHGWR